MVRCFKFDGHQSRPLRQLEAHLVEHRRQHLLHRRPAGATSPHHRSNEMFLIIPWSHTESFSAKIHFQHRNCKGKAINPDKQYDKH